MLRPLLVLLLCTSILPAFSQSFNRSFAHDTLPEAVAVAAWGDSTLVAHGFFNDSLQLVVIDTNGQSTALERKLPPSESFTALRLLVLPNRQVLLAASYAVGCDVNVVFHEDYYLLNQQLQITATQNFQRAMHGPGGSALSLERLYLTADAKILATGREGFRLFAVQNLQLEADSIFPGQFMGSIVPYGPDSVYVQDYSGIVPSAFYFHSSTATTSPAPLVGDQLIDLDTGHWVDWDESRLVLRRIRKSDFQAIDSVFFPTALGFSPELIFPSASALVLQQDSAYIIFSADFSTLLAIGTFHSSFKNLYRYTSLHFQDNRLRALGVVFPQNAQMEVFDPVIGPASRFRAVAQKAKLLDKRVTGITTIPGIPFRVEVWSQWQVSISNTGTDTLHQFAVQKSSGHPIGFCLPQWETINFSQLNLAPGDSFQFQVDNSNFDFRIDTVQAQAMLMLQPVMANGNLLEWHGSTDTAVLFTLGQAGYALASPMRVYPNPAREHLWLEMPATLSEQAAGFRLYNLQGQTVLRGSLDHSPRQRIAVGTLPAALYALVIEDEQGQVLARTKLRLLQ